MATRITINGKTTIIEGNGTSVSVANGEVRVNCKTVAEGLQGIVEVKWEGPAASVTSDASVTCGDVHGPVDAGGSVKANNITGRVSAGGSVQASEVRGNVSAGGSVQCGRVVGTIEV